MEEERATKRPRVLQQSAAPSSPVLMTSPAAASTDTATAEDSRNGQRPTVKTAAAPLKGRGDERPEECCRCLKEEELDEGEDEDVVMVSSQLSELAHYTFRLELPARQHQPYDDRHHPQSQQHFDDRFLIFRSDRRGAVAKLIYSLASAPPTAAATSGRTATTTSPTTTSSSNEDDATTTTRTIMMATIDVLECKADCRGHDLGGLLIGTLLRFLSHKTTGSTTTICQLFAEEEQCRYGRLVRFYEAFGFSIKRDAKIQFLNHNDGEIYRKVPMQMEILGSTSFSGQTRPATTISLLDRRPFLPVHLHRDGRQTIQSESSSLSSPPPRRRMTATTPHRHYGSEDRQSPNGGGPRQRSIQWLLVSSLSSAAANNDMVVEFRTTNGLCLHIDENGRGDIVMDGVDVSDDECYDPATTTTTKTSSSSAHQFRLFRSRDHVLWLVQSTTLGTYLAIDDDDAALSPSNNRFRDLDQEEGGDPQQQQYPPNLPLLCRATPHYWKFDPHHLRLYGTDETPHSRRYYCRYHHIQTVEYARRQRNRYLQQFRRGTRQLSIRQALETARDFDGLPFAGGEGIQAEPDSSNTNNNRRHRVDLRTACFATAEALRQAGHPDWVQLVGLIYHLGRTAVLIDDDDNDDNMVSSSSSSDSAFVWQHAAHARVLGVPIPESFYQTYPECKVDRHNNVMAYDDDPTIAYERHMGLLSPDLVLSWTGPEYLYHMIRYNDCIQLPEDGLSVLRLASLIDWHSPAFAACYRELENDDDLDVREFVHECADLLLRPERTLRAATTTTMQDSCEALWETHYGRIVAKYQADGLLSW
jgi:hypothetical protein